MVKRIVGLMAVIGVVLSCVSVFTAHASSYVMANNEKVKKCVKVVKIGKIRKCVQWNYPL
jgi:hypothetical protein